MKVLLKTNKHWLENPRKTSNKHQKPPPMN